MTVSAKELRYAVDLSASGELTDENGVALDAPAGWSPEHLMLAALVSCSLKSLRHHAKRAGGDVLSSSGRAWPPPFRRCSPAPRTTTGCEWRTGSTMPARQSSGRDSANRQSSTRSSSGSAA